MRVFFVLSALVLAAIAACSELRHPELRVRSASSTCKDTSDGAGGYVVKPTAVFWNASNAQLPYSTNAPDSCIDTIYYRPTRRRSTLTNQLDAGLADHRSRPTCRNGAMTPDTIPNRLITYRYHGAGVAAHAGRGHHLQRARRDAAASPRRRSTMITAKQLHPRPDRPGAADSLHLTWTIGQPGVAAVNIYLIYATTGTLDSGPSDHLLALSMTATSG